MTLNLKRVERADLELQSVSMYSDGDTLTRREDYKMLLRLECGHTLLRRDDGEVPDRAHCSKCPNQGGGK